MPKVKFVFANREAAKIYKNMPPKKGSAEAACVDLMATDYVTIFPNSTAMVPTGIRVELPKRFELQIRARSGLARDKKIMLANGIGTVDADYRGEIMAILYNGDRYNNFEIKPGDRICQATIRRVPDFDFELVEELSDTVRGENGFGSTGFDNAVDYDDLSEEEQKQVDKCLGLDEED